MVDDEVQCRIGVTKLSQRMQQGRNPRIARVNRCGTEPSVSAQPSHVWAKFHRGVKNEYFTARAAIPVAQACSQALPVHWHCDGYRVTCHTRVSHSLQSLSVASHKSNRCRPVEPSRLFRPRPHTPRRTKVRGHPQITNTIVRQPPYPAARVSSSPFSSPL